MHTIKELREICQSVHKGDFSVRIVRFFSVYITWLLIPTGITGNGVSALNCVVGVISGICLYRGGTGGLIAGALLFALNSILDGVDGEVARYRKKSSLTGLFADRINTIFVYPAVFYGAGKGLAAYYGADWLADLGMIGGWAMVSLRLLKTSIDATLVDALTMAKARQEESLAGLVRPEQFRPMGEILRDGKRWYLVAVDYVTFRQSGMCIVWLICVAAEVVARHLMTSLPLQFSPFAWMVAGYALLGLTGVVAGAVIVIRKRKVELQFMAVFGDRQQS